MHSTPRSPEARGWDCRFADRSSTPMAAGCGQRRMNLAAPYFSSPCPPCRERCVKTPCQMLFIDRLAKVADDPIVQGADPVNIVGIGSHEDRRNPPPSLDEVSVEFDSGHRRHVYVGDEAGGLGEMGGCEEICRRCK